MHNHGTEAIKAGEKIIIVGNPNVGKSVIFGLLTGRYADVSNYPGTTVTLTTGSYRMGGVNTLVMDTPGVNTLIPMSEDEEVTRDILINEPVKQIVQVVDAKNLSRGLVISIQLVEMVAAAIGTTVIPMVGVERTGLKELREALDTRTFPSIAINYGGVIEAGIRRLEPLLPEVNISKRAISLMLLAGDESLKPWLTGHVGINDITQIESIRRDIQDKYYEPLGYVINQIRLKRCEKVIADVLSKNQADRSHTMVHLGNWAMHPVWGIPVLLAVLFLTYEFVGVFGAQTLVELLENSLFGSYLNPFMTRVVNLLIPDTFFQDLLVGEYGIITMALTYSIAIILPIVGTFFIAFGILEDSGYLPRLAMMVNKIFKLMGLHGKAALPMVLGLGCDTMATLTARIMETRKERVIVTLLLALGVPCSAQLGV